MAGIGAQLEKALGGKIAKSRALPGGDIADVSLLTLTDGRAFVAKRPRMDHPDTTETEAMMLRFLAEKSPLPVPTVRFQAKGILVMDHMPHAGVTNSRKAAESIAEHIAALHHVRPVGEKGTYGFSSDTVIGPLPQKNTWHSSWCRFYGEERLLAMAQSCRNTNRVDATFMTRIETLVAKLPDITPDTPESSLLHGDLWAGNMLIDGDKAAGFIDPAISFGHREMDIAFMLLMGGLDPAFLSAYEAHYSLDLGYKERLPLYQLWPILVHIRLFAGGYVQQANSILDQYGV